MQFLFRYILILHIHLNAKVKLISTFKWKEDRYLYRILGIFLDLLYIVHCWNQIEHSYLTKHSLPLPDGNTMSHFLWLSHYLWSTCFEKGHLSISTITTHPWPTSSQSPLPHHVQHLKPFCFKLPEVSCVYMPREW